jgi:hypothetical protein
MKNNHEVVFITINVWYKTQNYGEGKKVNSHFRAFHNIDEAITFFNSENSAYKITAGVTIRGNYFMYGSGNQVTLFEKGFYDNGKPLNSDMIKKML